MTKQTQRRLEFFVFSPEDLITGAESITEYDIAPKKLLKFLKSGRLEAYLPIVEPTTTSNRNNILPGLSMPQRYSKVTNDEIQELNNWSVKSFLFSRVKIEELAGKTRREEIARSAQNIKNKPSTKSKKSLTKTQQRVLELAPQWQEYADERLKEDPEITIAKVIRSILRNDMALDPSGEEYADKTIRKYIKEIWPERKPGRPPNN